MRSRLPVLPLVLSLCAVAQNVRITWIGQSCFVIQTLEQGPVVVTDPPSLATGYPMPTQPADAVTVSHNHSDHNYVAGIAGTPVVVDGRPVTARQEVNAAGMTFVLVPGFHDNQRGAQRGNNTIIKWTQAGVRFAHLGDHGQEQLSAEQAAELKGMDVMFVPAGGYYTIDAARAATLIAELKPRIAVLMHFRTALGGPAQLAPFPEVTFPFAGAFRYQPASVVVNRSALPQATEVWLMEPAAPVAAVNAAGFTAGAPVAPGSLAALFGDFPGVKPQAAEGRPLPRKVGDTEVLIGGTAAPLLYVSGSQINFQVPFKTETSQHVVEVRVGGQRVARGTVRVIPVAPGVFVTAGPDGRLNTVRAGQTLTIYATGQGEVAPPVADGAPSPQPPAVTYTRPDVFIGYRNAPVLFSGLAPGWVGLWQINVAVPPDVPGGSAVPLVLNQGITSNVLYITVERGVSCLVCE